MFSKIVPAFTSDNIGALGMYLMNYGNAILPMLHSGPLVLVAVTYQLIGVAMAWTVKQFFWVPHRFRYGILVAGGWANWGDVRECKVLNCISCAERDATATAVIMSITGNAPFNASTDQKSRCCLRRRLHSRVLRRLLKFVGNLHY